MIDVGLLAPTVGRRSTTRDAIMRMRLRLQETGFPSEGHSEQADFRCDFSRYPTVAASETRHTSPSLFFFLRQKLAQNERQMPLYRLVPVKC
jgi:hypothetical protein